MKKANIHVLLVEELRDLLYEMNEVFNLHREVVSAHGEHLHQVLLNALFYISFAASQSSNYTTDPREPKDFVDDTISRISMDDGYWDRSDLSYAIEKCLIHVQHMRLAYTPELEEPLPTLLEIIELYLSNCTFFIYGKLHSTQNSGLAAA